MIFNQFLLFQALNEPKVSKEHEERLAQENLALSEELEDLRLRVVTAEKKNAKLEQELNKSKKQNVDLQSKSTNEVQKSADDGHLNEKLEKLKSELSQKDQQIDELNKQVVSSFEGV